MINEDDDDFLKSARRERGALPSGEYAAEIVSGSIDAITTPQTRRLHSLREDLCWRPLRPSAPIALSRGWTPSSSTTLTRDIEALASWQKAVGAGPSPRQDGIGGVLKAIWKAGKGKVVLLKAHNKDGQGRCDRDDPYLGTV